jgi:hypothetical protein
MKCPHPEQCAEEAAWIFNPYKDWWGLGNYKGVCHMFPPTIKLTVRECRFSAPAEKVSKETMLSKVLKFIGSYTNGGERK